STAARAGNAVTTASRSPGPSRGLITLGAQTTFQSPFTRRIPKWPSYVHTRPCWARSTVAVNETSAVSPCWTTDFRARNSWVASSCVAALRRPVVTTPVSPVVSLAAAAYCCCCQEYRNACAFGSAESSEPNPLARPMTSTPMTTMASAASFVRPARRLGADGLRLEPPEPPEPEAPWRAGRVRPGSRAALARDEISLARDEISLAWDEIGLAGHETSLVGHEIGLAGHEAARDGVARRCAGRRAGRPWRVGGEVARRGGCVGGRFP